MDPLLPVVLFLITWVLSERYYPDIIFLSSATEYWLLGGLTALFITFSIIIHELGHSLAAWYFHIPIKRIHLYLFGGMAELQYRPQKAKHEWWIAISGPFASLLLAGISWGIYEFFLSPAYLAYYFFRFAALINFLIALFNILPIFPLDGGRLLRSAIWAGIGNYIKASRLTYQTGSFFIGLLVILATLDYLIIDSGYSLLSGILALYMFYTYHTGRGELKYNPDPDELIFPIDHQQSTTRLVEHIQDKRPGLIHECIVPFFENPAIEYVVDGRDISIPPLKEDIEENKRPISTGDFIDLSDTSSFNLDVIYKAEWVPVLRNGQFLGMCDAREMRFWLDQNYLLVLKQEQTL